MGANTEIKCDDILTGLSSDKPVGVCRDMVLCQAQILEGMGNKGNVYALTYSTPGSYHSTLVATDPSRPTDVHKINYNMTNLESQIGGVAALNQTAMPDVGITYRIFKPSGEMVSSLPSEMGLVLNEMTGGVNNENFDPFIRSHYNIASAKLRYKSLHGNVFTGRLTTGDPVFGVGTYLKYKGSLGSENDSIQLRHDGKVGLGLANRRISTNSVSGTNRKYSVNQIYLNLQENISVPMRLSENFIVEPFINSRLAVTAVHTNEIEDKEKSWTGDGDLTVDSGVRARLNVNDGKTNILASVKKQRTLGLSNLSMLTGSNATIVTNHTAISGEVQHHVNDEVTLLISGAYAMREYGDTAQVGAGVQVNGKNHSTRVFTSYQAPVGPIVQGWQPGGASRSFSAGVEERIFKIGKRSEISINANLRQDFDTGVSSFNTGAAIHW